MKTTSAIALLLASGMMAGAAIQSSGSFVTVAGTSQIGGVEVRDVVATELIRGQRSTSYLARNGWAASRILIVAPAGTEDQPLIVEQPKDLNIQPGGIARFRVLAVSQAVLSYQWFHNGEAISGATNALLTVANVLSANASLYQVKVRTTAGELTSLTAELRVVDRFLQVGNVQTTNLTAGSTVSVPLILNGDGDEQLIGFSVEFDETLLSFARFRGLLANGVVTNAGTSVGVNLSPLNANRFPSGSNVLGELEFQVGTLTNQTALPLSLVDSPVAISMTDNVGGNPSFVRRDGMIIFKSPGAGTVNTGSGTLGDMVTVVAPDTGATAFIRVLIHDLGVDSLGNPIRVLNAAGTNANGIPFVLFPGTVQPGQRVDLDLEYYVSDRTTIPSPRFEIETLDTSPLVAPSGGELIPLARGLSSGGKFYVDFRTESGRTYYVQYRDNHVGGVWQTSYPAITGTGFSAQWIDGGPPRTTQRPAQTTARFYRVVRAPNP